MEGLETIATAEFVARIQQEFPGIVTEGGLTYWEGGERGLFEIYSSDQHVHVCCRGVSGNDMNTLIEIADEFDSRLYDPQAGRRFDGGVS